MSEFSIAKLQALDESEWARLQEEYFPRIYYYVRKSIKEHQTAEDVVQDTFLGAVRGIPNFKEEYTLDQFLFGIARNRIIDFFRKKKPIPISSQGDDGKGRSYLGLERFASERRSPDESAVAFEFSTVKREALGKILKVFVQELWESGDFKKLMILEYLLALGGRNKEAVDKFGARDEKAVAGIKFRALERLRSLARQMDPDHQWFEGLWKPGAR